MAGIVGVIVFLMVPNPLLILTRRAAATLS